MKLQSRSGFSLVELMVVVAIIGILATIAVPNFQKFQARAKQSSAKSELTGIYTAQKSFYIEYNTYHTNLPVIGYVPDGMAEDAAGCPTGIATGVVRNYGVGFGADGSGTASAVSVVGGISGSCSATAYAVNIGYYASSVGDTPAAGAVAEQDAFIAGAAGKVGTGSFANDQWQINHQRVLLNTAAATASTTTPAPAPTTP